MEIDVTNIACLDYESTTCDLVRSISAARNDDEISKIVVEIDFRGKELFGSEFSLRFNRSVASKDFRRRLFLKLPHNDAGF